MNDQVQGDLFALDSKGRELKCPPPPSIEENEVNFQAAVSYCLSSDIYCLDLETTGLDPRTDRITEVALAVPSQHPFDLEPLAWAFEVGGERGVSLHRVVRALRPLLGDGKKTVYGWNLSFDFQFFLAQSLRIKNRVFDGLHAERLLDEGGFLVGLKASVRDRLGHEMLQFAQVQGFPGLRVEYAKDDALWCLRVCLEALTPLVAEQDLLGVLIDIEGETTKIVAAVEFHGLRLDRGHLQRMRVEFEGRVERLREEIFELAGQKFNLDHPEALSKILFGDLKINAYGLKRGKSGWPSTAEKWLAPIADRHPIIPKILEYRGDFKILTTYLRPFVDSWLGTSDRVHASFFQMGTETGRYSIKNPGLHQLPGAPYNGVRKSVAAERGKVLVQADWSQVELRVLAWLSNCQNMLAAYVGENLVDLHQQTQDKTGCKTRGHAKIINFGLAYLMQVETLQRSLGGVSKEVAQGYWDSFYKTYPELNDYYQQVFDEVKRTGCITNFVGRKRRFSQIRVDNMTWADDTHREAINFPVQGGVGEVLKIACINIERELELKRQEDPRWNSFHFVLFVHDEILAEVCEGLAHEAVEMMNRHMREAVILPTEFRGEKRTLTLDADICICPYWGLSKLDPEDQLVVYRNEEQWDEDRCRYFLYRGYESAKSKVGKVLDVCGKSLMDLTLRDFKKISKELNKAS